MVFVQMVVGGGVLVGGLVLCGGILVGGWRLARLATGKKQSKQRSKDP